MAEQIKIHNGNLKALGSTSKAFNITKKEELMREYTLSFSVLNNDSVFKYLTENTTFKYCGQFFDVAGIDGDSGINNITQITAEHISYRLSDYTLPNGYSFVGTIKQIAQDVLNEAKTVEGISASSVFSVGVADNGKTVSFGIAGQTNVTAREALIAMSKLGLEISFDNFIVNLHERIGENKGLQFEYSVNLNGVHRTWQKGNGWNYDVKIVDLQKIPGNNAMSFSLGDDVTVFDKLSNLTINGRIISYTECDDPTQNHIEIGVFVRDNISLSIETDRIANSALDKADTSVQQGEKYSNVSITHTDGFKAVNKAGTQRVLMNADDCFVVQVLQSGKWITVNSTEAFGMITPRITTQDAKDKFYATVGKIGTNDYGLQLHRIDSGNDITVAEIGQLAGSRNLVIRSKYPITLESTDRQNAISVIDAKGEYKRLNSTGYNGSIQYKKTDDTIGFINVTKGEIVSIS